MDNLPRLRWACRRGMLELDVILMPFVENHYSQLPENEKALFQILLDGDDPVLFAWFMGHEKCPNPALADMIKKIHKLNGALITLE